MLFIYNVKLPIIILGCVGVLKAFDIPANEFFLFTSKELSTLSRLKDFTCGFSNNDKVSNRYDPWFCVDKDECNEKTTTRTLNITTDACDKYPIAETDPRTCCYIGNIFHLNGEQVFTTYKEYWGLSAPSKEKFHEFKKNSIAELEELYKDILSKHEVCGITPTARPVYENNDTLFIPYICWSEECVIHTEWELYQLVDSNNYLQLDQNNKYCKEGQTCCHVMVAQPKVKDNLHNVMWATRELPPNQKYAVGFRSSFFCELYSREVCDGDTDMCSMRVLDLSTSVPGEYPHQALIGVEDYHKRYFHCSGSLVSQSFILSTFLCSFHEKSPASIALLGEYDLYQWGEFGQRETLAYLTQRYTEPEYPANAHVYKHARMVLFKMWRPVRFHPWLRPACVNWKSIYQDGPGKIPLYPETAVMVGYGPSVWDGRWNRTLKRVTFNPGGCVPGREDKQSCETCQKSFFLFKGPNPRQFLNPFDAGEYFCQGVHAESTAEEGWDQPCDLDLGTSANVMSLEQTPFCMWKILGVNINPRRTCSDGGPSLYRIPSGVGLGWLEEVVWREDMNIPSFDLRWPKCFKASDAAIDMAKPGNLIHLSAEFDAIYLKDPY